MFVNLRGTSGSGKSTAVRQFVEKFATVSKDIYVEGRKKPLYTLHRMDASHNHRVFATLGHYETPCGGCDTLKKLDDVYSTYYAAMSGGEYGNGVVDFVIAEGKILGDDTKRIKELKDKVILHFTTPIEDCYAGVKQRRLDRGQFDKAEQKPKKLEADHRTISSAVSRLEAAGVRVVKVTRENVLTAIFLEGTRDNSN